MTTTCINPNSRESDIERLRANDPEITAVELHPNCDPVIALAALTALEQNTTVIQLLIGAEGPEGIESPRSELEFPEALRARMRAEIIENDEKIGIAIANLLKCNRTITNLGYLPRYDFSDCAEQIAAGFVHNETLTFFYCLGMGLSATTASLENTLRSIGQNRSIRCLTFIDTDFSDDRGLCLRHLAQREGSENQLEEFNLQRSEISEQGIAALSSALQRCPKLVAVDLCETPVGSYFGDLQNLIRGNLSLRLLNLESCDLGCQEAILLAEVVPTSGLTSLVLSDNQIGSAGGRCLARMLAQNSTLVSLCLAYNLFDFKTIMQLLVSLKANANLRLLNLYEGGVDGEVVSREEYLCLKQEVMRERNFNSLIIENPWDCGLEPYDPALRIPVFATILLLQNNLRSMTSTMKTLLTLGMWSQPVSASEDAKPLSSLSMLPNEILMKIIDDLVEEGGLIPSIDGAPNTRPSKLYTLYARSPVLSGASFFSQDHFERRTCHHSALEARFAQALVSVANQFQGITAMTAETKHTLKMIREGVPAPVAETRPGM